MSSDKKSILLVEDEAVIAMAEARMLEGNGYTVVRAATGERAIAVMQSLGDTIDLILMDIDLGPAMDGTQAAQEILRSHDVPILFLSSHTEKEIVEKTEKITSYGYVVKDTGDVVLLASIKMAFKLYNAHKQEEQQRLNLAIISQNAAALSELEHEDDIYAFIGATLQKLVGHAFIVVSSQDKTSGDMVLRHLAGPDDFAKKTIAMVGKGLIGSRFALDRSVANDISGGTLVEVPEGSRRLTFRQFPPAIPLMVENAFGINKFFAIGFVRKGEFLGSAAILMRDSDFSCDPQVVEAFARQVSIALYRHASEVALRESEKQVRIFTEHFRDLADLGQALIWTAGLDKKCNYFNKPWLDFTGRPLEEEVGDGWVSGVHPDDLDRCVDTYIQAFDRREKFSMDYRLRRFDGEYRWIQDDGTPRYNSQGEFIGYIGHCLDISDRKKMEERIRDSEQYYRALLETTPDAIVMTDARGFSTFASNRVRDLFRLPPDMDLVGKSVFDWVAPESHDIVRQRISELLAHPTTPQAHEYRLLKYDRTQFWGEITSTVLVDDRGRSKGLLMVCRDVTARRLADKVLRESEERFRSVWHNSADGMRLTDRDGRIVDVNEAYCKMVNLSREELIGNVFSVTYHDPANDLPVYKERFDSGAIVPFQASSVTLWNGDIVDLEISSSLIELGEQGKMFLCIFRDITERKRSEKALQQAKNFSENIIQTANVIFLQLDRDGIVRKVNKASEEISGYTRAEVEGKNWFETLVPRERYAHAWEEFNREISTGVVPEVFENTMLTKSGEERQILWKISLLHDAGRIIGTISFGLDITERKRAEDRIAQALKEKEILMKELQHRVKNNLNIVSSLLNLEAPNLADDRSRHVFKEAVGRIRSMAKIYEELYLSSTLTTVNLQRYIGDLSQSLFKTYSVDLDRVHLVTRLDSVDLEARRAVPLGLILNEVMTNALKYAFPGNERGEILVELLKTGDEVSLCVCDNGVGLTDEHKPNSDGSIGLKLVRLLTDQIDAALTIDSTKGTRVGVKFTL